MKKLQLFIVTILLSTVAFSQSKKPLELEDIMHFKQIKETTISNKGGWLSYTANPDRGNGEVIIVSTDGKKSIVIDRGSKTLFSKNDVWAAIVQLPDFLMKENKGKDAPSNNLILLNTKTLDTLVFTNVQSFLFSNNSEFVSLKSYPDKKKLKKQKKKAGSKLELYDLKNKETIILESVDKYSFDSSSTQFVFTTLNAKEKENTINIIDLDKVKQQPRIIDKGIDAYFSNLNWSSNGILTYFKSTLDEKRKAGNSSIVFFKNDKVRLLGAETMNEGWIIPEANKTFWSKDNERFFFGSRPSDFISKKIVNDSLSTEEAFNPDKIRSKNTLQVWHYKDLLIKPNEKRFYKTKLKTSFLAVHHFNENKTIQLCDSLVPYYQKTDNPNVIFTSSNIKYLIEATWGERYNDYYISDLKTGKKKLIASRVLRSGNLSPSGKYLIYYNEKNWHLYNVKKGTTINLTKNIKTPFYNEDHDFPRKVTGYGIAGWTKDDKYILIYDKFDIWKFNTSNYKAENITKSSGRDNLLSYRFVRLNRWTRTIGSEELVTVFNFNNKETSLGRLSLKNKSFTNLLNGKHKYRIRAKAKNGKGIVYSRESYSEFPDLWFTEGSFKKSKKLSNLGDQTKSFLWGSAKLMHYNNADGRKLDGIVMLPENYKKGKRYPVLVYFYRINSHRLFNFPDVVINHRPNFPLYTGNDYIVFMPDIVFEVGRPGLSSTKCLVPAVQKLIDMGLADPDAIGLHGHSWGGYQTAFVVTQTNIFKCAVTGAPVSNMTSAYGGIRWGSGVARQFQYEKTQSRIGKTLWNGLPSYIENSPLFFVDRIHTPMLIEHGDKDDAVPWYQSIELYLAMRRLGKDCIFLQYGDEPHHVKKYPNKVDYTIKMKEYFDFHLKGMEPKPWIIKGKAYVE